MRTFLNYIVANHNFTLANNVPKVLSSETHKMFQLKGQWKINTGGPASVFCVVFCDC